MKNAYLHRLSCDRINRSCSAYLEFVQHHVSQTLIIYDTDVDVGGKFLSSDPRVHRLISIIIVSSRQELMTKVIDCCIFLCEPKG